MTSAGGQTGAVTPLTDDDDELEECGWGAITATDLHDRARLLGVPASMLLP